tara:strand:- start:57 stop:680 length:624 start_codon:yes stop_codon:yes gene_type:complete
MLISILIPTLVERKGKFLELLHGLERQINKHDLKKKVEIISICDNRTIPLSTKRNMLQKLSNGKYFTHLDDDDELSHNYCKTVVDHIEKMQGSVDVITYDQKCFVCDSKFIVKSSLNYPTNLIACGNQLDPDGKINKEIEAFIRFPWQYSLWSEKFKKVYRSDSDTNAQEDINWLKKVKLEYPKTSSNIDFIGHIYHFEDPSLSTCQ